jgi:hypothetical protein
MTMRIKHMPYRDWVSPLKLRDYYMPDVANKQLFLALAAGDVRARCEGTIVDPRRFRPYAFDASDPFALPPDVELSVNDAQRKWRG